MTPTTPCDPGGGDTADRILHLLSDGRIVAAHELIDRCDEDDLFVDLARVDARLRVWDVDVPELQRLSRRAEAGRATAPGRWLWAQVLICERLVLDGDATGVVVALTLLPDVPDDPLPPLLVAWTRARLRRIVAQAALIDPSRDGRARALALRSEVTSELLRCGFREEAAASEGVLAGVEAVWWGDNVDQNLEIVAAARSRFPADGDSVWPIVLDFQLAVLGLITGDTLRVTALARDLRPAVPGNPAMAASLAAITAAVAVQDAEGSAPSLAALDAVLSHLGTVQPLLLRGVQLWVGQVLADLDHPGAGRYVRAGLQGQVLGPTHEIERRLMELRLGAAQDSAAVAAEAVGLLDALDGLRRRRAACLLALRLAHDLARAGASTDAAALHAWGMARLPDPSRRTPFERRFAIAPAPAAPADLRRVPIRLQVLAPELGVSVGGRRVEISTLQARLVLRLALAAPGPSHVEQLSDALWPDTPLARARPRLSLLVHRINRALGDTAAVTRDGDLLRLGPAVGDIDLAAYRRGLSGSPADRAAAVGSVRGNLCAAQFPYDDDLADARGHLVAEWQRHARTLLAGGHTDLVHLTPAATALGLKADDLSG